jgi:uncharacterized protein
MPFDDIKQRFDFELNEKIYFALDILVTGKFYTLFSLLFAVGFYIQYNKYKENSRLFLKTYRRRISILLIIGVIHSLIWFGDILLTYSIIAFILILFRDAKTKNLFRWSLFFFIFPLLLDLALLPFTKDLYTVSPEYNTVEAHGTYPDMTAGDITHIFLNGSIVEIFFLNIHHIAWKYVSYIPAGRLFVLLGIFLLGYYLSSINFFITKTKSSVLLVSSLLIGLLATVAAKLLDGNSYQFPPTLLNTLYKLLQLAGQLFLCIFYITSIFKISQTQFGKKALRHLVPVGRMALSNYLLQTLMMIIIFYNFGLDLIGKLGLIPVSGIAVLILITQIIFSNFWLRYYRYGPFEWIWRSLTYRQKIKNRYQNK